jgi:phosphoribosylformylglycinamidine cyclo-ligase
VPPIFQILAEKGKVLREEMYQVFNMGIGMVAVVAARDGRAIAKTLHAKLIGRIEPGRGITRLEL